MARFSVVVSALDERADLDRSLRAIGRAAQAIHTETEVVVVARAGDNPHARLAATMGAEVVRIERSSIAAARNAGARVATGQIIVTINADRVMSPVAFAEIERLLATGCYIGGGAIQQPERHSLAIDLAMVLSRLANVPQRARWWDVLVSSRRLRCHRRLRRASDDDRRSRLRPPPTRLRAAHRTQVRQPSPGTGDDSMSPWLSRSIRLRLQPLSRGSLCDL